MLLEEDIDVIDIFCCCGCLVNFIFCFEGVLKVLSGGNLVYKKRNFSYLVMLILL